MRKTLAATEIVRTILPGACFDDATLRGENTAYRDEVEKLHRDFGVDFVAMGPTAFVGAPLKWTYSAGATNERFKRISLAPGHGIGGIVLRSGKPMQFANIDKELDPREFSSYPIVFSEGLSSFCCLPLLKGKDVVGALLLAFRSESESHDATYRACLDYMNGAFCDLAIVSDEYLDLEQLVAESAQTRNDTFLAKADASHVITAQEEERNRISRELHDGLAQELLTVSMLLELAHMAPTREQAVEHGEEARARISSILDEIHDISVSLRPSTLDHFGLLAALRSQAAVYLQHYGVVVEFSGNYDGERFDPAYEIQTYRIIQEAMLNACKYAGESVVDVIIDAADGWINAAIVDHGKGFDVDNPPILGSGCGLLGMRERIALVGGTLEVTSGKSGTTVSLVAPMPKTIDLKEKQG